MDARPIAQPFRVRRGAVLCFLTLAMAGCSTTEYATPVDQFADATGKAKIALAELNAQVTEAYRGVLEDAIVNGEVFLDEKVDDCINASVRCRLAIFEVGPDGNPKELEPYPPEPPLSRMTLLMNEIDSYAANLQALLNADTAQKVEANVNAALGSVENLATTVSNLKSQGDATPSEVPQFATPTGAAVNWTVGQYIQTVKFKGLQRATAAAKPVIREAAELFKDVSTFASSVPKTQLIAEIRDAKNAMREDKSAANISRYAEVTGRYDALLASSPPDLFGKMADAHDALADNLNDESVSLATASARIKAFAGEAEELVKILQDLRKLAVENEEGGQ